MTIVGAKVRKLVRCPKCVSQDVKEIQTGAFDNTGFRFITGGDIDPAREILKQSNDTFVLCKRCGWRSFVPNGGAE